MESARYRFVLEAPAMQAVEIGAAVFVRADDLTIEDRIPLYPRGRLHDERIAFGPVGCVHRVQADPTGTDVYLEPVAVVLDLCTQSSPVGGFPGKGRPSSGAKPVCLATLRAWRGL
jgi:hypothetical protein